MPVFPKLILWRFHPRFNVDGSHSGGCEGVDAHTEGRGCGLLEGFESGLLERSFPESGVGDVGWQWGRIGRMWLCSWDIGGAAIVFIFPVARMARKQ